MLAGLTFWLGTLSLPSLIVLAIVAGSAGIACAVTAQVFLRRAWLVTHSPRSWIRSAAQGYVTLEGVGQPLPGRTITAPFSGKPCIWWSAIVEPALGAGDKFEGYAANPQLFELRNSPDLFLLKDGTGECLIDPAFAEVDAQTEDVWYGNVFGTESIRDAARTRRLNDNLRYVERRIEPHERLTASGIFHTVDGRADAGEVARTMSALLSKWKRNQPALLARFDTDGDGRINDREWEAAREEARREALASLTRERQSATHTLIPPDDGRDLLISTRPRSTLARQLKLFALLMVFLTAAAGAICADCVDVISGLP